MPDVPLSQNFERPPVVETSLELQFTPLADFRLAHYGLFLGECLGAGWQVREDANADAQEYERFGSKSLLPSVKVDMVDPPYQARFVRAEGGRVVSFQPNKLQLSWVRQEGQDPRYAEMRDQMAQLFASLRRFAERYSLSIPIPNFWGISYLNAVPAGDLWTTPADWHKVMPGLFPTEGPKVVDHAWGTFAGEWFFDMPGRVGRVRVKAQKVVANPGETIALLLKVSARGELSEDMAEEWVTRLGLGHDSASIVFRGLASPDALAHWGIRA